MNNKYSSLAQSLALGNGFIFIFKGRRLLFRDRPNGVLLLEQQSFDGLSHWPTVQYLCAVSPGFLPQQPHICHVSSSWSQQVHAQGQVQINYCSALHIAAVLWVFFFSQHQGFSKFPHTFTARRDAYARLDHSVRSLLPAHRNLVESPSEITLLGEKKWGGKHLKSQNFIVM